MKFGPNELLLRLACYMSLAISFLPIVDYYSPWYITLIPVAITMLLTLRIDHNIYPVAVAVFSVFCLWLLLYWTTSYHADRMNHLVNFFVAFVPCIISVQLNRTVRRGEFFWGCLKTMAIFTGITCITTIIGLRKYPMASRELASGTAIYDTLRYKMVNIGGYEFIYALVLLIPVLFWMIKRAKGFWKIVYVSVLVLDMLCIYVSQYTIALICMLIAWIVVWMQKNKRAATIFAVVLMVFLWLDGLNFLSQMFYWASDIIEFDYVSDRLRQVAQLISGQTVNTETSRERIEYYMNQLEAFGSSPILGHNWYEYSRQYISGHTFVLDALAGAGIVGGAILVLFFRKLYKLVISRKRHRVSPYIKTTWIVAVVIAILNPVIFSIIITIAFMCCMCINKIEVGESWEFVKGQTEA